jgi:hypothetical protein
MDFSPRDHLVASPDELKRRSAVERDDQRVMTFRQWCDLNGFSKDTGRRLIKAGQGPKILQLSPAGLALPFAQIANGSRQGSVREIA